METLSRESLMAEIERRAFAARVSMARIHRDAGVSSTVFLRWRNRTGIPSIETIGKLEAALDAIERERAL